MSSHRFEITNTWDGRLLRSEEWAHIELELGAKIEVRVEAAYYGDLAPPGPAGRRDGLWEFEVVELFLLGAQDRYLEIELGPHGDWLGLSLAGPRIVVDDSVSIEFEAEIDRSGGRWSGRARIDRDWEPIGLDRANAYAIHGTGADRRYLAMSPVLGDKPDFHRLEFFTRLTG